MELEGVESVFSTVGKGATRFLLTYTPEDANPAYAQMIVRVDEFGRMAEVKPKIEAFIRAHFPDALAYAKNFVVGPGGGSDVELRIRGRDHETLRELSEKVKAVFRADPDSRDVRDDWREKVLTVRPVLAEPQASSAALTRADVSAALLRAFEGRPVGIYRERDELIPIVARSPEIERSDVDTIRDVRIWSRSAGEAIPLLRVVTDSLGRRFETRSLERRFTAGSLGRRFETKSLE